MSLASSRSAWKHAPSIRATIVSARSVGVDRPRRLGGQINPFDALRHDRFHHCADDRRVVTPRGWSPASAATVPGMPMASASIIAASDNAGTQRTRAVDRSPLAREPDLEAWHDRAAGRQAHTFEGDPAEPRRLGPIALPFPIGVDRDEPAQRVLHRIDKASLDTPSAQADARVQLDQPCGGPPTHARDGRQLVVRLGHVAPRARPDNDPARRPRGLQHHFIGRTFGFGGPHRPQQISRPPQASDGVGEIGHDVFPFVTGKTTRRGEAVLSLSHEASQQRQRRRASVPQERDVVIVAASIRNPPDRALEFCHVNLHSPSTHPRTPPLGRAHASTARSDICARQNRVDNCGKRLELLVARPTKASTGGSRVPYSTTSLPTRSHVQPAGTVRFGPGRSHAAVSGAGEQGDACRRLGGDVG